MVENIQGLYNKKLNMDTHWSLLGDQDIVYMLNGDIQGKEGQNSWFIQNALGNEQCGDIFPPGYTLVGHRAMNNYEHVLFFVTTSEVSSSEIGIYNSKFCSYETWVNDPCLNFSVDYPIRAVYKHNNAENDRRIYFIDGLNPNRFIDIDKPYPQSYIGSKCDDCDITYTDALNCDEIRMNRLFNSPCADVSLLTEGSLISGVYQVGFAYRGENVILSDFYFTQPIKTFSEASNIGLKVELSCLDSPFEEYHVILVSQTRESGLVVYDLGEYSLTNRTITITNINNATILDTGTALSKRTVYDYSQHIATNSETLFLGKHLNEAPLNYQPQANNIQVKWQLLQVPKDQAHLYPSFMRDEVYGIAIEWFHLNGTSLERNHIPGREANSVDLTPISDPELIYELEDCVTPTLPAWKIENTASATDFYGINCVECSGQTVSAEGVMGYWESENLTYPNDPEVWGDLACQPIRHHRMPMNDIAPLQYNPTIEFVAGACETIEYEAYDIDGIPYIETFERCEPDMYVETEVGCVNILTIRLDNIEHPLDENSNYRTDIAGYRILVSDRKGNKSVLHKGLIYNTWSDQSLPSGEALYPNYPYNDLFPDELLTKEQNLSNADGTVPPPNGEAPSLYYQSKFTYHSPDIHYRETAQEFGTEMKIYGEMVGAIEGNFSEVDLHPITRLGRGSITADPYRHHAAQFNSVCYYNRFLPFASPILGVPTFFNSRFRIDVSQYLLPIKQLLSDGTKFNNHYRETSYYVGVHKNIRNTTSLDTSRLLASEFGYLGQEEETLPSFPRYTQVEKTVNGSTGDVFVQAASFYVGIKVKQPDQYGPLEQINYIPNTCIRVAKPPVDYMYSVELVPGDIFVTKHSIVRKMPLFTQWLEDVPFTTEIDYRLYRNVWYPRNWYDNLTNTNDNYNLDGQADIKLGSDYLAAGRFYLFYTGVIDFWCESEFIGNYRERAFTPNGSFYPKADYNDLVKSNLIPLPEQFLYNFSLLNGNIEKVKQDLDPPQSDADYTVIYSQKNDLQAEGDPWLKFLPLNYSILPRTYGKFTGIHSTDMYSIFFIFEDQILYSQINFNLSTNQGNNVLLNQGDVFDNRLLKLSNEETGYVGSMDPWSFINTRFGTFFIDRKRKKLFNWDGKLQDITGNMEAWFQEYLKDNDLSAAYNKSIISVFDNFTGNLYFTEKNQADRWTISYKPQIQGFVSFHSFTPDFYLPMPNTFLSYHKDSSDDIWKHNSKYVYQSYYGNQAVFDVGVFLNAKFKNAEVQSIELFSEWFTYQGYNQVVYNKNKFFDKIFAYNNNGSTGLLTTVLKNKNNAQQNLVQNLDTLGTGRLEVTQVNDSIYRLNKLEDNSTQQPFKATTANGMGYTVLNSSFTKAPQQRGDLKGKWAIVHFISDNNTNHKILLQLFVPNEDPNMV